MQYLPASVRTLTAGTSRPGRQRSTVLRPADGGLNAGRGRIGDAPLPSLRPALLALHGLVAGPQVRHRRTVRASFVKLVHYALTF
jgi:hypothetical protein